MGQRGGVTASKGGERGVTARKVRALMRQEGQDSIGSPVQGDPVQGEVRVAAPDEGGPWRGSGLGLDLT